MIQTGGGLVQVGVPTAEQRCAHFTPSIAPHAVRHFAQSQTAHGRELLVDGVRGQTSRLQVHPIADYDDAVEGPSAVSLSLNPPSGDILVVLQPLSADRQLAFCEEWMPLRIVVNERFNREIQPLPLGNGSTLASFGESLGRLHSLASAA